MTSLFQPNCKKTLFTYFYILITSKSGIYCLLRNFAEKARKLDKEEEREKQEAKQKYLTAILRQMETDVERKARQRSASLDEHKKIALAREVQEDRIRAAMKAKYLELARGPVKERHLGFVRAKFDMICREQGIKPVTPMLTKM